MLNDGDTFVVDGKTFEFDMGVALDVPNMAGNAIAVGDTFSICDISGNPLGTFEFTHETVANDGTTKLNDGNFPITFTEEDTSAEVAQAIAQEVNKWAKANGSPISADAYQDRVMLNKAAQVKVTSATLTATPDGTTANLGYGTPAAGANLYIIPITSTYSALQVANAMSAALQKAFKGPTPNLDATKGPIVTPSFKVDDTNGDAMVRMVGHTVNKAGPLPYANQLAGDGDDPLVDAGTTQFTTTTRGQDNNHGGFYIDNVIIGFAERGEMVTDAVSGETGFTNPDPSLTHDELTKGPYQLQIREASEYATWDPTKVLQPMTLDRSFDVNDRLDKSYSLIAPAAVDITGGSTFSISDGATTVTFQFVDKDNNDQGWTDPNAWPVEVSAGESAIDVANEIAYVINYASQEGWFKVTAATNGDSAQVRPVRRRDRQHPRSQPRQFHPHAQRRVEGLQRRHDGLQRSARRPPAGPRNVLPRLRQFRWHV